MTVYDLGDAAPAPAAGARRTAAGRVKMLLVLAVCAAPVVASYLTYFVIKPEGRSNYGSLILPTRALPEATLHRLDGGALASSELKGQWLLVAAGPAACDAACQRRLFALRQLREMLGRERGRLDKVWLLTDGGQPAVELVAALQSQPAMHVLRVERGLIDGWLAPEPGRALDDHLYLVDPMGEWMMRFPVDFEPAKVKRDIDRLMRASAAWDRPGR